MRVQKFNPYDNKQWFIFNWRTKTIRYAANARMVVSIQINGNNWNANYAAVVRQYRGQMLQKVRWFSGTRRTIRDVGQRCLDLPSMSPNYPVYWKKCHGGQNQGWYIDRKGMNYPKQPLRPGVKFQIKSIHSWGLRALFKSSSHMGGGQYYAMIQDSNPADRNQWMTFDLRTQSIRMFYARNMCVGNRVGYGRRNN